MSKGYKCELCHKRNAKYQYFETDGRELYVCGVCRNKRWADFAPELLDKLKKLIPDADRALKVSKKTQSEEQDQRLCNALVLKLLQIRSRFKKTTNVFMVHPVALPTGEALGAFAVFLPSERKITLEYTVMDTDETVLSQFGWYFDVSDPEHGIDCEVKWKFTLNGEATEQTYGIGNIIWEHWRNVISVVNMLDDATPKGSMKLKDFLDRRVDDNE